MLTQVPSGYPAFLHAADDVALAGGVIGARAKHKLGQQDAREWYDKAVAWMDKNKPDDEELKRFRAEAEEVLGIKKD